MEMNLLSVTPYPKQHYIKSNRLDILVKFGSQGSSSIRTLGVINTVPLNDWKYRKYFSLSF